MATSPQICYIGKCPLEVLEMIAEEVFWPNDLTKLSRVHSVFYNACSRMLYRHAVYKEAINWAIQKKKLGTLEKALECGVDPNKPVIRPKVKGLSVGYCHPDAIIETELEMESKATRFRQKWFPLHKALRLKNNEVLGMLLDQKKTKIDVNTESHNFCCTTLVSATGSRRPSSTWSALHMAICSGNVTGVRLLILHGAQYDPSQAYHSGLGRTNALHEACNRGFLEIAQLCHNAYGGDIDQRDIFGYTALWHAVMHGQWNCAEWLIKQGADIYASPLSSSTNPHKHDSIFAALCGKEQFHNASRLLSLGFDISKDVVLARQILRLICFPTDVAPQTSVAGTREGQLELVRKVCKAKPELIDRQMLINAVADRNASLLSIFLRYNTENIEAEYRLEGHTLLMKAVVHEDAATARVLLRAGADMHKRLLDGYTLLSHALLYNYHELVEVLVNAGADIFLPCHNVSKEWKNHIEMAFGLPDRPEAKKILARAMVLCQPDRYIKLPVTKKVMNWASETGETALLNAMRKATNMNWFSYLLG